MLICIMRLNLVQLNLSCTINNMLIKGTEVFFQFSRLNYAESQSSLLLNQQSKGRSPYVAAVTLVMRFDVLLRELAHHSVILKTR